MPVADGGEGTVEAFSGRPWRNHKGGNGQQSLDEEDQSTIWYDWFYCGDGDGCCWGIALLDKSELNPMNTTTYGVGEMIKDAIASGCREFIIGIGGSATNDGGTGMLHALGFSFLDADEPHTLWCKRTFEY